MALTDGMSPADFAAINGNDGFGGSNGAWWIILLLLCGWNNGNFGNGGYVYGNGGYGGEIQRGFDQAALTSGLQTLQSGQFDMMQSFQNCCCENRIGVANLGAQIAADGCSTRQTFSDAMRDMIYANAQNSQAQINAINAVGDRIDSKLCQLEMDAKNDKIADLQRQVEEANDAARYNGLIAEFNRSQDAQTTALEQYLHPVAIPSYNVPNPNCCGCQQSGMCGY